MGRYQVVDVKIKDFWLYIFTGQSFDIFVFDLNRIAFLEAKTYPQKQFEEALVQFYLDHIQKDIAKELKYRQLGPDYNSDEDPDLDGSDEAHGTKDAKSQKSSAAASSSYFGALGSSMLWGSSSQSTQKSDKSSK